MTAKTVEGIVENGKIRLPPEVHLPENAKVLVVLPASRPQFVGSPRLVNREEASLFKMEVLAQTS